MEISSIVYLDNVPFFLQTYYSLLKCCRSYLQNESVKQTVKFHFVFVWHQWKEGDRILIWLKAGDLINLKKTTSKWKCDLSLLFLLKKELISKLFIRKSWRLQCRSRYAKEHQKIKLSLIEKWRHKWYTESKIQNLDKTGWGGRGSQFYFNYSVVLTCVTTHDPYTNVGPWYVTLPFHLATITHKLYIKGVAKYEY